MSQDNKMPILLSMGSNLFMGGFLLILFMNISHSIYYKIPLSYHYFFGGKQLGGGKFFLLVIYALLIGLFISVKFLKNICNIPTRNTQILTEEVEEKANNMSNLIFSSAFTYLIQEYKYILLMGSVVMAGLAYQDIYMALGFFLGALLSCGASFFSMYLCVKANIRTSIQANRSLKDAFNTAFFASLGGSIFTYSICLLCPFVIYMLLDTSYFYKLSDICFGTSFGCSFICIFGRIAGGIFTKAADVGADLVGKIESELEEDDARNPAVIADNVGDNVGDCNGMIADVFESYAVTLLMAILFQPDPHRFAAYKHLYSYLVASYFAVSIIGLLNTFLCKYLVNLTKNVWGKLQFYFYGHVFYTALLSVLWFLLTYKYFGISVSLVYKIIYCGLIGYGVSVGILKSTEYYTSSQYSPVQKLAEASNSGHGTNIIYGLSISFFCVGLPLFIIITGILLTYMLLGFVGIILASIAMMSLTGAIITLDLIGPITDNAGGIAEVSGMDSEVRDITDHLDAVGNVTKAITKGFSIGAAVFTSIITNMLFVKEVSLLKDIDVICSITQPVIFCGILIGGIITYLFCGLGLRAVGEAAQAIVENVREQLRLKPGILTREEAPDYRATIVYLTKVSIQKMILPALLPIIIPVISFMGYKYLLGSYLIYDFLAAISLGTTLTAIFLSINMTTAGGAWDNSKKYIEEGHYGGKKSFAHMCAVTGDTVGDPYKDTVGPALNALAKLVPIVSYLIVRFF